MVFDPTEEEQEREPLRGETDRQRQRGEKGKNWYLIVRKKNTRKNP